MNTPLAWLNLMQHKAKTLIAVAGVGFAVSLMFVQLGFLYAVQTTAKVIYSALDFDVVIRSNDYLHFADTRSFPLQRLLVAASHPAVVSASPFYLELNQWRVPNGSEKGTKRGILTVAARPGDPVFNLDHQDLQTRLNSLQTTRDLLVDQMSRPEFGQVLRPEDVGTTVEVASEKMTVRGHYRLGTGMAANGAILVTDRAFAQLTPGRTLKDVSLGLIRVRPGADPRRVAEQLAVLLPDVSVLPRRTVIAQELNRWVWEMPIGIIFVLGVVVSVLVGTAIVYQILSSDVTNRMAEYATLKAMGYSQRYLSGMILRQASWLALLGFIPGLGSSLLVYSVTRSAAKIPMALTSVNFSLVLVLTFVMCILSGLASLRKLQLVDPADLF